MNVESQLRKRGRHRGLGLFLAMLVPMPHMPENSIFTGRSLQKGKNTV